MACTDQEDKLLVMLSMALQVVPYLQPHELDSIWRHLADWRCMSNLSEVEHSNGRRHLPGKQSRCRCLVAATQIFAIQGQGTKHPLPDIGSTHNLALKKPVNLPDDLLFDGCVVCNVTPLNLPTPAVRGSALPGTVATAAETYPSVL